MGSVKQLSYKRRPIHGLSTQIHIHTESMLCTLSHYGRLTRSANMCVSYQHNEHIKFTVWRKCAKEKTRRIYSWTMQTSVVASDIHLRWSTHVIRCMRNPIWDLKEALGRSSSTWSRVVWLEGSNMSQVPSASSWAVVPRNWSRFLQKVDSIYQTTRCHISKDRTPKHNFVITITIFPTHILKPTQSYMCTEWR